MDIKDWYLQRAYSILSDVYPTDFDCGLLCDSKCCNGSDNDGMLLFPGEEKLFENQDNFIIKETQYGKTLICSGKCDRSKRPIACRIFPLFPYIVKNENGYKITVLKDVRALQYCPLDEKDVSQDFKRAVRIVARNLLRDEQNAEFLVNLTNALTDFGRL